MLRPGRSAALGFDGGWTAQAFPRRAANRWRQTGAAVEVESDASVSLLVRPVLPGDRGARRAAWRWQVDQGVPATDLARKGGDDRNLAVYFVFLPEDEASRLGPGASPRRLLGARGARTLMYVWGGAGPRGQVLPSPWLGDRGRTVILRPGGVTGAFAEAVDLAGDHARAFGTPAQALVGLALSADSDDTGGAIRARLWDLELTA